MEGSTSSFAYKGSIADAISMSRSQRKLFVVYISDDDENSIRLEESTWADSRVAVSISKCCIFLHLCQGSMEASQFSAIYPQQSLPSITAVGDNGVILWKHEGFVDAENFVENIEKAWAALHLQGATATLLAAALTSKKHEPSNLTSSSDPPFEQGSSSSHDISSASAGKASGSLQATKSNSYELVDQGAGEENADLQDVKPGEQNSLPSDPAPDVKFTREGQANLTSESGEIDHPVSGTDDLVSHGDADDSIVPDVTTDQSSMHAPKSAGYMTICSSIHPQGTPEMVPERVGERTQEKVEESHDSRTSLKDPKSSPEMPTHSPLRPQGTSPMVPDEVRERTQVKVDEMDDSKSTAKANEVHLNIRLPSGSSLQTKFSFSDPLRLVKNHVDENQTSAMGQYSLAVPYPRKVFDEQDMNKALSELGFASRQALIVVPLNQVTGSSRGQTSNGAVTASKSTESSEGYFGYVKRMLSYANPFSYFGGNASSSSSPPTQSGSFWQYSPNPGLQNQFAGAGASQRTSSINHQSSPSGDPGGDTRGTSRPFGSNIHTLRHDEDEGPSGDRNTFWNGNSTQYGGNDR